MGNIERYQIRSAIQFLEQEAHTAAELAEGTKGGKRQY
jgi:hypothetical protein